MGPGRYEYVGRRLESMRAAMMSKLAFAVEDIHALGESRASEVNDEVDIASNGAQQEVIFAQTDASATDLEQINLALLRIAQGVYGICEDCGRPIAEARLVVLPTALRDVPCEQLRSKRPQDRFHRAEPLHPQVA